MMTREEAIKLLKQYQGYDPMFQDGETLKHAFDLTDETVDALLTALRPVSRERVERAWKGEWIAYLDGEHIMPERYYSCSKCGGRGHLSKRNFCDFCGAPMTDAAVDMAMKRMKELK